MTLFALNNNFKRTYRIRKGNFFFLLALRDRHDYALLNHKNYNFLACDWFKNVLFSTNSFAKLLSDSLLLDSLLLDSLLSNSSISQSHSKM